MRVSFFVILLVMIATPCLASETAVKIPGVEVVTDGSGTSVKVPGVSVTTDGAGTSVHMPEGSNAAGDSLAGASGGGEGEDTVINNDDGILTIVGQGQDVTINGDNNNVVVDGFVENIVVNGDENIIDAREIVAKVNMTGDKNTVLLPTPPDNASVQLVDVGEYNKLQYR